MYVYLCVRAVIQRPSTNSDLYGFLGKKCGMALIFPDY